MAAVAPFLSVNEALGCTYGSLAVFAIVAGLAVPFMMRELKRRGVSAASPAGTDFWYSARNSQGWVSIALSLCATSAGAWLLYTPAEAAYLGGWWALLGYCVAITLGPFVMCFVAPIVRDQFPDAANITDWVGHRFGAAAQIYVTLILIYYMFIYLVGQLKTMGDLMTMFTGGELAPEHGLIPVAVITVLYTMVGGLPASIVTDQIQAIAILVIVVVVSVALFTWVDVEPENWQKASVWTDRGFEMGTSLCFAVFGAEVWNLAFWQRVYAARDTRQLRIGFVVGALLVSALTFLFGLSGMLLRARDLGLEQPRIVVPAFAFFELLNMPECTKGIRVLVYILAVAMACSCADSFQIGITSVISRTVQRYKFSPLKSLGIAELFVILINVPAVAFAIVAVNDTARGLDGLAVKLTDLFGMADILTITLVVPVFVGIWPFATSKGCMCGMLSGILTIMLWGWVEFRTFMGGLEMITLMCFGNIQQMPTADGAPICGLYAHRSTILFFILPLITGSVTFVVSFMERVWEKVSTLASVEQVTGDGNKVGRTPTNFDI